MWGLAVGSFIASIFLRVCLLPGLERSGPALGRASDSPSCSPGRVPSGGWLLAWITLRHTRVPAAGWGPRLLQSSICWDWRPLSPWSRAPDRLGRRPVMITLAWMSTACSFLFGWTIGLPLVLIMALGALYAFSSLGDSPVLSQTDGVGQSLIPGGVALGLRSLLGFGVGFGPAGLRRHPRLGQSPESSTLPDLGLVLLGPRSGGAAAGIWTMHRLGKERVSERQNE